MRLIEGEAERGPIVSLGVVVGAVGALALTVLTRFPPERTVPVLALAIVLVMWQRRLLAWRSLVAGILLVIFFIPIRYTIPGNLPFQLEPYRLLVALVLAGWLSALLVDPRVRLRKSGLEGPLLVFVAAAVASDLANWSRVTSLGVETNVTKSLTFLLSFVLVVYLVVSVVRSAVDLDFVLRALVGFGAVLAACAIFESASGYNVFDHLSGAFSFLRSAPLPYTLQSALANSRGGRLRVYASSQSPIALSALFVIVIPMAVYLACTQRRKLAWWTATAVLGLGAISTISRTGVLMLAVVGAVFLWLRPQDTRKLWPLLVPALLAVHIALPGSIGALTTAFLPSGGIVAQQESGAGTHGSGRLADVGPSLKEWSRSPILGEGYGTRVVDGPTPNASILDDQWLGTLLETGLVGVLSWTWLLSVVLRRLVRRARADRSNHALLCVGLTASVTAYAVGMLTYDAFAFVQVTLVMYVLLGLSVAALGGRFRGGRTAPT
jgi:hypothetical protein